MSARTLRHPWMWTVAITAIVLVGYLFFARVTHGEAKAPASSRNQKPPACRLWRPPNEGGDRRLPDGLDVRR